MEAGKRSLSVSMFVGIAAMALVLGGCGGDEEDATAAATSSGGGGGGSGANQAPRISGSPPTSITQGTAYAFTPSATDPDGNSLTFSVANLPAWATFNSSTGRLSGTPTAAQVGTYASVTITVSDGSTRASLPAFTIQVVGTATGSATLSWNPPTQNTDGSAVNNLAGYRVYWGMSQGSYPNSVTVSNPGLSSYVIDQLTPARWYFVVTAYTSNGSESNASNVASKQVL